MEDAIEIMQLRERVSKNTGRRYFVGELNGCRVVALSNEAVAPDEGIIAVWSVFIQPGKTSRWKHTEKGMANAQARISKARQQNIETVKSVIGERPDQPQTDRPGRRAPRPAATTTASRAQQKAIVDINSHYPSDLNDPIGDL
jgi:hypothetical protein